MESPNPPQVRTTGEHYDLRRTWVVFMVFAGHQRALTGFREPDFLGFVSWEAAVGIFFALSGYLVSESWRRDPSAPRYLQRRASRGCSRARRSGALRWPRSRSDLHFAEAGRLPVPPADLSVPVECRPQHPLRVARGLRAATPCPA